MVPVEAVLFGFLLIIALMVTRVRDLFAAAMLTGIFSLLSAGMFTLMDAVDVAFTEAAVGAGVATVLVLGCLSLTDRIEHQQPFRPLPLLVVLLTGAALLWGVADINAYGDPAAVIHHHTVPEYISGSRDIIGLPNIVTSVLASYRGYDTFGETTVIFTAGIAVMALLGRPKRPKGDRGEGEA